MSDSSVSTRTIYCLLDLHQFALLTKAFRCLQPVKYLLTYCKYKWLCHETVWCAAISACFPHKKLFEKHGKFPCAAAHYGKTVEGGGAWRLH